MHKKTTTFFALDEEGQPVRDFNRRFVSVRSDLEGYSEVCGFLRGTEYQILVENSTKTHDTEWIMRELCMSVIVAHSPDLKKITKSNSKTDKNDARDLAMYLLARFAGADQFNVSYMCSRDDMMDRQLCRAAKQNMVEYGRMKRRVRSHALLFGIKMPNTVTSKAAKLYLGSLGDPVMASYVRTMENMERERDALEREIEGRFEGDRTYEKIRSIPYFGPVTAAYLSAYICDISRFKDSKAFVASLGLVPRERNSGEKESHCGITKSGDPHARWLLIQATVGHVRGCEDSPVTRFFNMKNGGSLKDRKEADEDVVLNRSAIVAAAAKMARIIYTLVMKDREW